MLEEKGLLSEKRTQYSLMQHCIGILLSMVYITFLIFSKMLDISKFMHHSRQRIQSFKQLKSRILTIWTVWQIQVFANEPNNVVKLNLNYNLQHNKLLHALHLHMQAQKHALICDVISIKIYTNCMQVLYS